MTNKRFFKIQLIVYIVIITAVSLNAFSQNNSLYSTAAIGQRSHNGNPLFSGIGTQSVSYIFPNALNTYNPASYSFLKYQYPIFSINVYSKSATVEENNKSEDFSNTKLSDIAFGLSFSKRFGLAFGFKPTYETNYSFLQTVNTLNPALRYRYQGSGNTNKAYVGFSVKIINKDSLQWSIGSNFGSLFGRTEHLRKSTVVNAINNAGGVEMQAHQIRSFHYDLGTVVQYKLSKGQELTLGAVYEPEQHIKSTYNRALYFASPNVDNPKEWGLPINQLDEKKGKINLPQHIQMGIAYTKNFQTKKKNNDTRHSQLLILTEYSISSWSKYKETYADSLFTYGFKDKTIYQIGFQYIPETSYIGNVLPKLLERTNYRLGFYSMRLPYVHNNDTQFSQWAATLGFGFPLMIERKLDSSIQLSIAAGKRTNSVEGSMNETFITVGLGVLITPGTSDRWFIKRKLD